MWLSTVKVRLAIGQLPREPTFRPLGYATLTRDYAILPIPARSCWPMLAMLSLPYTGYAHAILCWCFILAYSDSNTRRPRPEWRSRLISLFSKSELTRPRRFFFPAHQGLGDSFRCARCTITRARAPRPRRGGSASSH